MQINKNPENKEGKKTGGVISLFPQLQGAISQSLELLKSYTVYIIMLSREFLNCRL